MWGVRYGGIEFWGLGVTVGLLRVVWAGYRHLVHGIGVGWVKVGYANLLVDIMNRWHVGFVVVVILRLWQDARFQWWSFRNLLHWRWGRTSTPTDQRAEPFLCFERDGFYDRWSESGSCGSVDVGVVASGGLKMIGVDVVGIEGGDSRS